MLFRPRPCQTVSVVSPDTGEKLIINFSVYNEDPDKWTLWEEEEVDVIEVEEVEEEKPEKQKKLERRVKKKK